MLSDILGVVREDGETGSHQEPVWDTPIAEIGKTLNDAVASTLDNQSLAELLDKSEK